MEIGKIYLIDFNEALVSAWQQVFVDLDIFEVIHGDFFSIEADAVVSPANSFGIMDGGLDLAIRNVLGFHVEKAVQKEIIENYHGELPVGSAVIVPTENEKWPFLISAPTMRVPMTITGTLNAYQAFRAILIEVNKHNADKSNKKIKSIICPGLGTGIGDLDPRKCAAHMRVAYTYINKPARIPSFNEIHEIHKKLQLAI